MKALRSIFAVVLAASMLLLAACDSPEAGLTDVGGNSSEEQQAQNQRKLSFTTSDIDGNAVSMEDYREAKVVMFNMWEPWCGPCRNELPDLQKLYKKYKGEGLMIVGVFSTERDVRNIVKEDGIRYPMIRSCEAFGEFDTGYVPTTIFTDGEGNLLSEEPYIGSQSYKEWEDVILSYLNKE